MSELCDCGGTLRTLGTSSCPVQIGRDYKWIFMPTYKADGTVYELDLSSNPALNAAYFAALIAQGAAVQWNVSPVVMNSDAERADDKTETFNNDTEMEFVQQGMKTVKGIWTKLPANLANTIKGWNCSSVSCFIITDQGQLLGLKGSAWQIMRPIKIQTGSFVSKFVQQNNVTIGVQKAMVQFNWDAAECDSNLVTIEPASFASGYDIKSLNGLIQVDFIAHLANTATTVKVAANTNQGSLLNPVLVTGLIDTDFTVTNRTTGANVVVTGATEIDGKYVITYTSQTGNLLALTCSKTGYQFATYNYTSN